MVYKPLSGILKNWDCLCLVCNVDSPLFLFQNTAVFKKSGSVCFKHHTKLWALQVLVFQTIAQGLHQWKLESFILGCFHLPPYKSIFLYTWLFSVHLLSTLKCFCIFIKALHLIKTALFHLYYLNMPNKHLLYLSEVSAAEETPRGRPELSVMTHTEWKRR